MELVQNENEVQNQEAQTEGYDQPGVEETTVNQEEQVMPTDMEKEGQRINMAYGRLVAVYGEKAYAIEKLKEDMVKIEGELDRIQRQAKKFIEQQKKVAEKK